MLKSALAGKIKFKARKFITDAKGWMSKWICLSVSSRQLGHNRKIHKPKESQAWDRCFMQSCFPQNAASASASVNGKVKGKGNGKGMEMERERGDAREKGKNIQRQK